MAYNVKLSHITLLLVQTTTYFQIAKLFHRFLEFVQSYLLKKDVPLGRSLISD